MFETFKGVLTINTIVYLFLIYLFDLFVFYLIIPMNFMHYYNTMFFVVTSFPVITQHMY